MSAERAYKHNFQSEHRAHLQVVRVPETTIYQFPTQERTQESPQALLEFIAHFDTNWREESLPRHWYTLGNKVGFSMQTQMNVLGGVDRLSREQWVEKTTRDVQGFALEYLTKGLVYPFSYEFTADGGLVDPKYGNTDFEETTSEQERSGSVKKAYKEIKDFFLDEQTTDGSMVVITSPLGPSGLTTDEGKPIDYPDSYFFILQKTEGKVNGVTIKTDFSKDESRDAIKRLTGKALIEDAPLEEYVASVAYLASSAERISPGNIIDILSDARSKSPYAFQRQTWHEVYRDIDRQEELYQFSEKTEQMLEELKAYVLSDSVTKIDIQKALAATVLRISKEFLFEESAQSVKESIGANRQVFSEKQTRHVSFGHVLDEVANIPGCAGGGKTTTVQSLNGVRIGVTSEDGSDTSTIGEKTLNCTCPSCNRKVEAVIGNGKITCPECSASAPYEC